jgi:uncharacterized protein (DUF1015 family)
MASIFPFAAWRPAPDAAREVAAVPYDVIDANDARALAAAHPLSFLHVSRAEVDMPPDTDAHADAVYAKAAENLRALERSAPMVVEDRPLFYVYRLHMGDHVQTGVAACFSIDEYEQGTIRKHEKTRPDKEDDRTRHMLAIGAQTGPVFLTYRTSPDVDAVVERVTSGTRSDLLYDFTADDGVRHAIWRVPPTEHDAIVGGFARIPALYIADGHHRAASAARARRALASTGPGEHDRMLAVAFPDRQMRILPYNRVVRDLNGQATGEFLAALEKRVAVTVSAGPPDVRRGEVGVYLGGLWRTLALGPLSAPDGRAEALDVSRLQHEVLQPLLGIRDVRTDERIDFVGGIRGPAALEALVDNGRFAVAFALAPVTVDDLMRIADEGGIMPPKSTWFEPKLRDGLLSHLIESRRPA